MKKILLLLVTCIGLCPIFAQKKDIKLGKNVYTESSSQIYIPAIKYDNKKIYIYSGYPLEHIKIKITNSTGKIIYECNDIAVRSNKAYTIDISHIKPNRTYKLELGVGQEVYNGFFNY